MSYTLDGDSLRFRGEAGTQLCALDVPEAQVLVVQGTSVSTAGAVQGLAAASGATDALASGLFTWKAPVAAVVTDALAATYSGGVLTSDTPQAFPVAGVQAGDRVLLTGQTTQAHNGVYQVTNAGSAGSVQFVLTRATDFQAGARVAGAAIVSRESGATGLFLNTNNEEPDWTTDAVAFEQVGGGGGGSTSVEADSISLDEMEHSPAGGELFVYAAVHADPNVSKAPKRLALGMQGNPLRAGAAGEPQYAELEANGLAAGAVQETHLDSAAVTTDKLADGAVQTTHINGTISTAALASSSVQTVNFADGAFTVDNNFVTTAMLGTGAVGTTQLVDVCVNATKLQGACVGTAALANNCVGSQKLPNNAVATANLADDCVTSTLLATTLYKSSISAIGNAAGMQTVDFATANTIRVTAAGVVRLTATNTGVTTVGGWVDSSDRKWKHLQGPVCADPLGALDFVDGVSWTWKADGSAGAGVIAQDFARACPQAVTHDVAQGGYVVNYNAVTGFSICCAKALKRQTEEIQGVLDAARTACRGPALGTDLDEELALQGQVASLDRRVRAALSRVSPRSPRVPHRSPHGARL
jgi:hypothetical protein